MFKSPRLSESHKERQSFKERIGSEQEVIKYAVSDKLLKTVKKPVIKDFAE